MNTMLRIDVNTILYHKIKIFIKLSSIILKMIYLIYQIKF
jgi:hypothetical protein